MVDKHTLARPYAVAIFEVANESNDLANWSKALVAAKDLLIDDQVMKFLAIPTLTDDEKLSFLLDLLKTVTDKSSVFAGGHKQGTNALKLLLEYRRISVLPEIAEHFDKLKSNAENMIDVTMTSVVPLSSAEQKVITTALKERFGREIHLQTEINENLIGGVIIRAGDIVIDRSMRSRLESLSNELIA
jgi:F-type H+-transporting ATPase subunit delta